MPSKTSIYSSFSSLYPLCLLLLSSVKIHGVYSVCDKVQDYTPIPPADYDRTYSSIESVDKFPLGFTKGLWVYNAGSSNGSNPCFKVTGAANRRIEIMFETFPTGRLCLSVQDTDYCSDSGTGRLYRCLSHQGNDIYLEFKCDSQCTEGSVQFWYRFVLGELPKNDPEDHWCDQRDQSEYPQDLLQLPSDFDLKPETTTPLGEAVQLTVSYSALLLTAFCMLSFNFNIF